MKDKIKNPTHKDLTPPKPLGLRVLGRAMLKAGKENNHQTMVDSGNKFLKMAADTENKTAIIPEEQMSLSKNNQPRSLKDKIIDTLYLLCGLFGSSPLC